MSPPGNTRRHHDMPARLAPCGYSAGAVVATPTLCGIELVDPPDDVPRGYDAPIPWDGMGLVDFSVAPH